MIERVFSSLFGSRNEGFELSDPKAKYTDAPDPYDCFECRALGSAALVGTGIYTYHSGMKNLNAQRAIIEASRSKYKYGSRQLGIIALSLPLIGAGFYRAFN